MCIALIRTIGFLTRIFATRIGLLTGSLTLSIAGASVLAAPLPVGAQRKSSPESAPVIVLDPGHSGKDVQSTEPQTGLIDHDYPMHPEMEECFRVAKSVQSALQRKGYRVILTKTAVADTVSLRRRAAIAQDAHAAMGVSIHDDHGKPFSSFAQVYAQQVGLWRGNRADHPKAVFSNRLIAADSLNWAKIFAQQRSAAEGHKVAVTGISFNRRQGIEPGNIPQVSLFAGEGPHPIAWIYNEVGGIGLGRQEEAKYARGLVNAIETCLPLSPAQH